MDAMARDDEAGLLSTLKGLAFFLAAYLYFGGFIFEHYLYRSFGIPLGALDIPFYYVLIYSYTVIQRNPLWIILVVILSCGVVFLSFKVSKIRRYSSAIIVVLLLALFPTLFSLARRTGESLAARMRAGEFVNTIRLVLKPDAVGAYPPEFVIANKSDTLRLITESRDALYVLQQNTGSEPAMPTGFVYRVPKDSVVSACVLLDTIRKPRGGR